MHWARFYLAEAGYIDRSRRGVWTITDRAQAAGHLSDAQVDAIITQIQESTRLGRETSAARQPDQRSTRSTVYTTEPPANETVAPADDSLSHAERLLTVLKSLSASGFERLCQRVLREAGFEQVAVTGRSGDGGIDGNGVLALNAFVSFRVLFQCKRYDGSVGPGHVRDFRGAMQGRADKGIIMTTGTFSADARREAVRDGVPPIELVDGEKLVHLFEELELGLVPRKAYEVDERFFDEYRQ